MQPQLTGASHSPDWPTITEEILCPLCHYNLQGLMEPRCPECGYTFDWPDLLDPTRRLHPYLFEHHPERSIRSFWRTTGGICRPGRFWRSLQPAQPSRPGRLMLYWLISALLSYGLVQGTVAMSVYYFDLRPSLQMNQALQKGVLGIPPAQRAQVTVRTAGQPPKQFDLDFGKFAREFGSVEKGIEHLWPTRLSWGLARRTMRIYWRGVFWPAVLLLWPWVTFAAMMIFRRPMRQARIRPIHVLRCCIYNAGSLVWAAVAVPVLVLAGERIYRAGTVTADTLGSAGLAIVVGLLLWMVYQMVAACRLYLRLGRPLAVVLASQAVAVLFILTIHSVAWMLLEP